MSMEAVPKKDLSGIESIIFIKPEDIVFQRDQNGKYRPYQLNKTWNHGKSERLIVLITMSVVMVPSARYMSSSTRERMDVI